MCRYSGVYLLLEGCHCEDHQQHLVMIPPLAQAIVRWNLGAAAAAVTVLTGQIESFRCQSDTGDSWRTGYGDSERSVSKWGVTLGVLDDAAVFVTCCNSH